MKMGYRRKTYDLWCRLPNNQSVQIWRQM